jgi:hypothetical protein
LNHAYDNKVLESYEYTDFNFWPTD